MADDPDLTWMLLIESYTICDATRERATSISDTFISLIERSMLEVCGGPLPYKEMPRAFFGSLMEITRSILLMKTERPSPSEVFQIYLDIGQTFMAQLSAQNTEQKRSDNSLEKNALQSQL
jgi:hypothetical protein